MTSWGQAIWTRVCEVDILHEHTVGHRDLARFQKTERLSVEISQSPAEYGTVVLGRGGDDGGRYRMPCNGHPHLLATLHCLEANGLRGSIVQGRNTVDRYSVLVGQAQCVFDGAQPCVDTPCMCFNPSRRPFVYCEALHPEISQGGSVSRFAFQVQDGHHMSGVDSSYYDELKKDSSESDKRVP